MVGFLIRRIGQSIFVLFIVTAATLGLVHLFPGGPVRALLGVRATPFLINYYNNLYGFNQPFYVQYLKWVGQLLQGNLGFSDKLNLVGHHPDRAGPAEDRHPRHCSARSSRCCSASRSASTRRCAATASRDYVLTGVSFLGYSTPTFFLGIVLVDWFAVDVHLFPPFAPQSSSVLGILGDPRALVLPVFTYAFCFYAIWSRYMRSYVLDNLVQDYVRTARAKGASERRVIWGHVFRNSLVSIVTLLGLSLPALVGGAILIEVGLQLPGHGPRVLPGGAQQRLQRAARLHRARHHRDDHREPACRHRLRPCSTRG